MDSDSEQPFHPIEISPIIEDPSIIFENFEEFGVFKITGDDDEMNKENIFQKKLNQMTLKSSDELSPMIYKEENTIKSVNNDYKLKFRSFNEEEKDSNVQIVIDNNNDIDSSDDLKKKSLLLKYFKNKDELNKKIIKNKLKKWKKIISCPNQENTCEDKKELFEIFKLFNPRKEKDIKYEFLIEESENNNNIFKATKKDKRKYKSDDIQKKIKARFLKRLRIIINENLTRVNSEKTFEFLPQCFVKCINKKNNKIVLDMTIKELLSTDFYELYNNNNNISINDESSNDTPNLLNKKRSPDQIKYQNNIEVLKYLENNDKIYKSSNFDVIEKMTFRNAYEKFLESKEFEDDIIKLIETEKQKEKPEDVKKYIKLYITKAKNYINDFQ